MTQAQLTSRRQSAMDRAANRKWLRDVQDVTATEYMVRSTSTFNKWYVVEVDAEGGWHCQCAAAREGVPCVHTALAYRVRHGLGTTRVTVR